MTLLLTGKFVKFTIARRALEKLLKAVASRPGEADRINEEDTVTLSGCAGRVFVEFAMLENVGALVTDFSDRMNRIFSEWILLIL